MIRIEHAPLGGIKVLHTKVFRDHRGHFRELWHASRYESAGIDREFVQDNVSVSVRDVIRGLHYQYPRGQGKLVSVLQGEIWDVAVDVRRGSPSFGEWYGVNLSAANGEQLYIPEGFAHGFAVLSKQAVVAYKCTDFHHPESERTILWNDPEIGIQWPVAGPVLSEKDLKGDLLREVAEAELPG